MSWQRTSICGCHTQNIFELNGATIQGPTLLIQDQKSNSRKKHNIHRPPLTILTGRDTLNKMRVQKEKKRKTKTKNHSKHSRWAQTHWATSDRAPVVPASEVTVVQESRLQHSTAPHLHSRVRESWSLPIACQCSGTALLPFSQQINKLFDNKSGKGSESWINSLIPEGDQNQCVG